MDLVVAPRSSITALCFVLGGVGLVPARFHARRAKLMGVLMGPMILG